MALLQQDKCSNVSKFNGRTISSVLVAKHIENDKNSFLDSCDFVFDPFLFVVIVGYLCEIRFLNILYPRTVNQLPLLWR